MKRIILSIAVLGGLALTSCKKDRTCDCQVQTITKDAAGNKVDDDIEKEKIVILKSSRKTARNACTHTKYEYDNSLGGKSSVDSNCSLD